ncbi:MAG: ribonuclease N1, partial [Dehalococcoidia bacterium]
PFPYAQDGTVFHNYEGLLPKKADGYYHEYTVSTPGSPDRGARRIVAGGSDERYYTDDHYNSFRLVVE